MYLHINNESVEYPYELHSIKNSYPNVSFPNDLFSINLEDFNIFSVAYAAQPSYEEATQKLVEGTPVLIDGKWTQVWEVQPLNQDELDQRVSKAATEENERIAKLWQSAHDVEFAAISGSAIGLITMGVLQGKPKCLAVQNWIKTLWTEYYVRKAGTSTDYDFSAFANCPYSVPELMTELGMS